MTIAKTLQGRRNRAIGATAEQIVRARLMAFGLPVAHLETGWRVQRTGKRIVGATPLRPVLADLVSCLPNGQMILVEAKREESDRLPWSRLEAHQRANLDKWSSCGALCLVAWVHPINGVALIPWGGAPGWGPRHALPWTTAWALTWCPAQSLSHPPQALNHSKEEQ